MRNRINRKAAGGAHPMQTLLPDPFDEGPEDDRIIRLARWASVMYPGKQFSLREIARLTGIPAQRLSEINLKMMERLDEALARIVFEMKYSTEISTLMMCEYKNSCREDQEWKDKYLTHPNYE